MMSRLTRRAMRLCLMCGRRGWRPLRAESDQEADPDFHGIEDADLEAHAARAGIFLDRLKEDDGMDEQSVLDFEVAAAFLVTQDFNIAAVNRAAAEILAIVQGDPVSKLDIQDEDKAELRNAITIATSRRGRQAVAAAVHFAAL